MTLIKTNSGLKGFSIISYIFFSLRSASRGQAVLKMVDLKPCVSVRGMMKLDRSLFSKTVTVPCLKVKTETFSSITGLLKKYLLKLHNLKSVRPATTSESVVSESGHVTDDGSKEVLLNPKIVFSFNDFTVDDQKRLSEIGVNETCLHLCSVQLTYDNWMADDVLTAVLPEGVETAASYSLVGHIVHVNLREQLLDYKHLIGEVLLDKVKQARTVVNKVDTIDNTFRVFNMEVLAGEHDFVTEVKENSLRFKFDFSAVYWNPRLSTEHGRIVEKLTPGDLLYDVFAGVGPFAIPAAKKKCVVLANDLNPESYKWLQHNAKLNKVEQFITTYNKDGIDFIKEDIKQHLLQQTRKIRAHVVMNLPASAVTFLHAFKHLFSIEELKLLNTLPLIHIYCFVKGERDPKEMAKELIEVELNCSVSDAVDEIFFVRNVAPNKNMMRVSFQLTEKICQSGKRKFDEISKDK